MAMNLEVGMVIENERIGKRRIVAIDQQEGIVKVEHLKLKNAFLFLSFSTIKNHWQVLSE